MNAISRYFDLTAVPSNEVRAAGVRKVHWLPQWTALFAGVLIQPFFAKFQATGTWDLSGISGWTLFALIVAVLIFPGIYKGAFDNDKPVVVQIIPIFASGMGWQSLLATAVRASS